MSTRNTQNSARAAARDDDTHTPTDEPTAGDDTNPLRVRVDQLQQTITEYGAELRSLQRSVGSHDQRLTSIDDKLLELLSLSRARPNPSSTSDTSAPSATDTQHVHVPSADDAETTPNPPIPPHMSSTPSTRTSLASGTRSRATSIGFTDPVISDVNTLSGGGSKLNFVIKPEELGTFDGTPEDTELFLANIDAIYQSEPDDANLPAWEKAILRALPRTLRDEARLWFASLDDFGRKSLKSLKGEGGWFAQLRGAFKPPDSVVRIQARDRTWDPENETISHYIFAKVALLKAGWPHFKDIDCIADVVAGVPDDLARVLRVPLLEKKKFPELRAEMRIQEAYWRSIHSRPLSQSPSSDAVSTRNRAPVHGALVQPSVAPPATFAQSPTRPSAPPTFGRSSRRGKSIRSDFDPSRLGYGINPSTGQRNMTYKVPDTDEIMWCARSCRICKGDHFDFAHDYCSTNAVHVANVEDEDDYPVTSEVSHF
ncbi:hypothetical protein CF319_g7959 [Tilletia indica]|nr:hypothetical protein CF319_g7959 [Tilletia indica]